MAVGIGGGVEAEIETASGTKVGGEAAATGTDETTGVAADAEAVGDEAARSGARDEVVGAATGVEETAC